ncbi:hypothetical protein WJX72_002697 [[Myrmecia] bisecta]|uniref:RRM domain-containing protein n=1 Tax=[Myrmecia] bisecta TaxID=41462 RepID=A0AAW1P1T8_9CHLO
MRSLETISETRDFIRGRARPPAVQQPPATTLSARAAAAAEAAIPLAHAQPMAFQAMQPSSAPHEPRQRTTDDSRLDLGPQSRPLNGGSGWQGQALQQRSSSMPSSNPRMQPGQSLSPSLMQHIKQMQSASAWPGHQDLMGWGLGSPQSPPPAQMLPFGMMPYPQYVAPMAPYYMVSGMVPAGMAPYGYAAGQYSAIPMMPGTESPGFVPKGMQPIYMAPMTEQQWHMMQQQQQWMYYQQLSAQSAAMRPGRSASMPSTPISASAFRAHIQAGAAAHMQGAAAKPPTWPATLSGEEAQGQALRPQLRQDVRQDLSRCAQSMPIVDGGQFRAAAAAAAIAACPAAAYPYPEQPGKAKKGSKGGSGGGSSAAAPSAPSSPADPPAAAPAAAAEAEHAEGEEEGGLETDEAKRSLPVLTLYVGNLPPTVDEYALAAPFGVFGPITNIQVIRDKNSYASRGFAFVTYAHPMYASIAIEHMDGMPLHGHFQGREIKVGPSNRG